MEVFTIRNLTFAYPEQEKHALSDLTLSVQPGEFLVLCGPSGCGKSTLLRQLKTVLAPHGRRSGEILFDGRNLDSLDQREQAEKDGKPYYDNDLVVAKPDGSPISASWVSSQFGKLLEDLDMPHIRFHDLRHTAATNMHQLTGDFYTVGEVLGHTLAGIGVSLGLSMNFEAVTARYVDVRLERKKEVLDAYHGAVKQADPAKAKEAEPKKAKSAAKKKSSEIEL